MSVEIFRKERGQELKKLRKSKGLTQGYVSKISGISLPTIIRMERGKSNYGVDWELKFRLLLSKYPDKIKKQ